MNIFTTELIALMMLLAVLLDKRVFSRNQQSDAPSTTVIMMNSYWVYLVLAFASDAVMNQMFLVSLLSGRVIILAHLFTFPALLFHWMTILNHQFFHRKALRKVFLVQGATLVALAFLIGFDIGNPIWFILDSRYQIAGGLGLYLVLLTGGGYTLVTFGAYVRHRYHHNHERFSFSGFVPLLMFMALLLLLISRHHDVFTISGALGLLLRYLAEQHQRQELDELTKIPDQYRFMHYCTTIMDSGESATLMILDCENFRFITEQFGIKSGDELLKQLADFYVQLVPQSLLFRIGRNRFALSVPYRSHNDLVRLVNRVQGRMKGLWEVGPYTISLHVNIGFLQIPDHVKSHEDILDAIEFLFSEIGMKKRQSVLIYNKRLIVQRQRQMDVLTALRQVKTAPERVKVYYQPIYAPGRNQIIGAEALMRIEDPQLGMLMPGEFIPPAERSGLIGSLTEIMLSNVCQFLVTHGDRYSFLRHVFINISAEDFSTAEKAHRILKQIKESNVDPRRLCIEMTESAVFSTFSTVQVVWEQLAAIGVSFALDDFGTGYANLETLVTVPFNVVKIDRSVVTHSHNNFELVNLIALVLERLEKPMIAEGIETREQLEFIQAAGIDMVQGYYFSRPIPELQFLDLLQFEKQK